MPKDFIDGPIGAARRFTARYWHHAIYLSTIAIWIWSVGNSALGRIATDINEQLTADVSLLKFGVGPMLFVLWFMHERVLRTDQTVQRVETKLDPVISGFTTVQSMEEAAKAITAIVSSLGSDESANIDFFGHNLTRAKDYVATIVCAPGPVKKLVFRILAVDPTVDPSLPPLSYFGVAKEVKTSLKFIQGSLRSSLSKFRKLTRKVNIEVRAYQIYPYIGGFRVNIPCRETTYFFVAAVGIHQNSKEPGWYDKYVPATVRTSEGELDSESCPPINFYFAELYTALFEFVLEKESKPYCTLDFPANSEFTYQPPFNCVDETTSGQNKAVNPSGGSGES